MVAKFPGASVHNESGGVGWFDDFHVLPRSVDLGAILEKQTVSFEVFCAFRDADQEWTLYVNNELTGSKLNQFPAFPYTMNPLTGRTMALEVFIYGPAKTESTLVFTFTATGTITVPIAWERFVFWDLEPELPFQEQLSSLSDVLVSRSGGEKRHALLDNPRQSWDYRFVIEDGLQRQVLRNKLFDFHSRNFLVPVWKEEAFISSDVTIGDLILNVDDTSFRDFRVGNKAVVFTSSDSNEVLEIASFDSTSITFTDAMTIAHLEGVSVFPVAECRADATVEGFDYVTGLSVMNVRFRNKDNDADLDATTAFSSFNSKVLLDNGNVSFGGVFNNSFRQDIVSAQGAGLRLYESLWERHKLRRRMTLRADGLQAIWEARGLFHALKGQVVSFYVPSDTEDLIADSDLTISTAILDVENSGYTTFVRTRLPLTAIRVVFVDGSTPILRTILSSTETSTTVERLIVDSNWTSTITVASILRIEFVHKVRAASDDVEISYDDSGSRARFSVEIKGVFE